MNKKLKYHLHKYVLYDILAIILFIVFSILILSLKYSIDENNKTTYDYSHFDTYINMAYKINPESFIFDENSTCELNLEDIEEIIGGTYYDIPMTANLDECLGNIIIKKENNKLTFDYSHICEMRDY